MKTGWKLLIVAGAVLVLAGSQVLAQPWGMGPGGGRGLGPGPGIGPDEQTPGPGPMGRGFGPDWKIGRAHV